ncbi:hypothetical protein MES5069_350019 [Mesorhizobium escarrei]|uniref:Uncharacterized protein n=1 Tax=Mesorhizobium escarrei TaxID=666018 RepID=A0ABM9E0X7_9HYPH|nr:hypothetical protein MES5069_350019 [Mesorhizobium escarrei]
MARSGEFTDCRAMEAVLKRSERERTRLALGDPMVRFHIDRLCMPHRGIDEEHPRPT